MLPLSVARWFPLGSDKSAVRVLHGKTKDSDLDRIAAATPTNRRRIAAVQIGVLSCAHLAVTRNRACLQTRQFRRLAAISPWRHRFDFKFLQRRDDFARLKKERAMACLDNRNNASQHERATRAFRHVDLARQRGVAGNQRLVVANALFLVVPLHENM